MANLLEKYTNDENSQYNALLVNKILHKMTVHKDVFRLKNDHISYLDIYNIMLPLKDYTLKRLAKEISELEMDLQITNNINTRLLSHLALIVINDIIKVYNLLIKTYLSNNAYSDTLITNTINNIRSQTANNINLLLFKTNSLVYDTSMDYMFNELLTEIDSNPDVSMIDAIGILLSVFNKYSQYAFVAVLYTLLLKEHKE